MKKKIMIVMVCMLFGGCSVVKVFNQPGAADLKGIGIGTTREDIIGRLGAPKLVDTSSNGNKQDVFEFQSGMHQASKVRAVFYLAADVFTLSLAEVILWPLEMTALDSATCTAVATYDIKYKVESWSVTNKKNSSSAQGC